MTDQPPTAGASGSLTALGLLARRICGAGAVISDPLELATHECDGLTSHSCSPGLVVLPTTAEQVAAIVKECACSLPR